MKLVMAFGGDFELLFLVLLIQLMVDRMCRTLRKTGAMTENIGGRSENPCMPLA